MARHTRDIDKKIIIIGVGNSFRSDDGVGLLVAKELRKLELSGVSVVTEQRDGLKIMDHWSPGDHVVIVDAIFSGSDEGTILRVDLMHSRQPASAVQSTHSFDIAGAVRLSKVSGTLPASVILYGIEGKNFTMGTSPSEKVLAAGDRAVKLIAEEIQESRYSFSPAESH